MPEMIIRITTLQLRSHYQQKPQKIKNKKFKDAISHNDESIVKPNKDALTHQHRESIGIYLIYIIIQYLNW